MNMGTFEPHFSSNCVPAVRSFELNDPLVVDHTVCGGSVSFMGLLQSPENPAEEAEDAARVARGGRKAAQKQA